MAKKFHFELNREGVAELMKSPEMVAMLREAAQNVRDATGMPEEYGQGIRVGKNRAWATVWPDTWRAKGSNRKHNTLLKALGRG